MTLDVEHTTAVPDAGPPRRALPGAPDGQPPRRWQPTRTQIAVAAWAVFAAAIVLHWGLPTRRDYLFLLIGTGLIALSITKRGAWTRVIRDWFPLFAILAVYDRLRGMADQWGHVHYLPQIRADEWLFGGTVPTVRLQQWLWNPSSPHWWDYLAFLVYLSHFVASFVIAAVLWKVAYPRFRRFALLFVTLTFTAFATYALFPAAPPWLASQQGEIAPTVKVIDQMWIALGLRSATNVISSASHLANPVAAVPSLHSAYPFLIMLFFWRSAGRWRWLLPLYPTAMGLTLVYGAEHYVIDVLLGWGYAAIVFVVANELADRWQESRTRRRALRELATTGLP